MFSILNLDNIAIDNELASIFSTMKIVCSKYDMITTSLASK